MTHPEILAALARERVNTFLGEAQAARRASLAGRGRGTVEYEVALVIPPGDPGYDQTPQLVSQPC